MIFRFPKRHSFNWCLRTTRITGRSHVVNHWKDLSTGNYLFWPRRLQKSGVTLQTRHIDPVVHEDAIELVVVRKNGWLKVDSNFFVVLTCFSITALSFVVHSVNIYNYYVQFVQREIYKHQLGYCGGRKQKQASNDCYD